MCGLWQQPVAGSEQQFEEEERREGGGAGKVQLLLRSAATKHYSFSAAAPHVLRPTTVHTDGLLITVQLFQ